MLRSSPALALGCRLVLGCTASPANLLASVYGALNCRSESMHGRLWLWYSGPGWQTAPLQPGVFVVSRRLHVQHLHACHHVCLSPRVIHMSVRQDLVQSTRLHASSL